MSTYTEYTEKATNRLFEAVKPAEDLAAMLAGAVNTASGTLSELTLPKALPPVAEVVTANFAVLERLLAAQKEFALRLAPATA
jgi:hypothetical protein